MIWLASVLASRVKTSRQITTVYGAAWLKLDHVWFAITVNVEADPDSQIFDGYSWFAQNMFIGLTDVFVCKRNIKIENNE